MLSIFDTFPGFLELGAWTTRHIRPLFDLFRDEDVAPALALIIFGSALVLCFLFIIDSSFTRGLIDESGSIGERVAQAAMQAGEESRGKVVDAGTDLAQTLSGIGQQLTDAVNRMQEGLNGTVPSEPGIECHYHQG